MGLRVPNTFLGVLGANAYRGKAQEDLSARATPSQRGFAWVLRAVGLSLLAQFSPGLHKALWGGGVLVLTERWVIQDSRLMLSSS